MSTVVWWPLWLAMASHTFKTFWTTAEKVICGMTKFARMEGCFPEGKYASYLCSRWKKESVKIPPKFHQELLDYVQSSLKDCAGGLPNATAPRLSVRKIYPRDTNTRSSGFLEVRAVRSSRLKRCHRLRNLVVFWKLFIWIRRKSGEAQKLKYAKVTNHWYSFLFLCPQSHHYGSLYLFSWHWSKFTIFVGTNSGGDLNLPE